MKHLSLLALLSSGAAVSTATGPHAVPGAPDLAPTCCRMNAMTRPKTRRPRAKITKTCTLRMS
ncbi:MAG: hypothetical protein CBARDCOR_4265 [uncultured Caballeronia sp.]|nr:MAG: hypothetical protein CBARDCOR_4265 [uncultured Caballeronia sp.]